MVFLRSFFRFKVILVSATTRVFAKQQLEAPCLWLAPMGMDIFPHLKKTSSLGSNTLYCKLKQCHFKCFGTFKKTLFFYVYMGEGLKLGEKCEGWIKCILFH